MTERIPADKVGLRKVAMWLYYILTAICLIVVLAAPTGVKIIFGLIGALTLAVALAQRKILKDGMIPTAASLAKLKGQAASANAALAERAAAPKFVAPGPWTNGVTVLDGPTRKVEIDDERMFQESFRELLPADKLQNEDGGSRFTKGVLVREPENPDNDLAIGLWVHGRQVGYLPYDEARAADARLKAHELATGHVEVRVRLWAREDGAVFARATADVPESLLI